MKLSDKIKLYVIVSLVFIIFVSCGLIRDIFQATDKQTKNNKDTVIANPYELNIVVSDSKTLEPVTGADVSVQMYFESSKKEKIGNTFSGVTDKSGKTTIYCMWAVNKNDKRNYVILVEASKTGYKNKVTPIPCSDPETAESNDIGVWLTPETTGSDKTDSTGTLGPQFVEKFVVPNDKAVYTYSKNALEKGVEYELTASGEVSVWSERTTGVDACYCYSCDPLRLDAILIINGKTMHDLNGETIPFSKSHTYKTKITGDGKKLKCYSRDAFSSGYNNSGSFTVSISKTGK